MLVSVSGKYKNVWFKISGTIVLTTYMPGYYGNECRQRVGLPKVLFVILTINGPF